MKKLIVRIVLYVLIVFFVGSTIIYLNIKNLPAYTLAGPLDYFYCKYQYDRIESKSTCTNIIVGDSRGNADINPTLLGSSWINLSISGGDFFEGYIAAKHFASRNKVDTLVMVYGVHFIEGRSNYFNVRTVPFQLATVSEMESLERLERRLGREFHGDIYEDGIRLRTDQLARRLRYNHFPLSFRETFVDGMHAYLNSSNFFKLYRDNIEKELEETNGTVHFGNKDSCNKILFSDVDRVFTPDAFNPIYLDSLVQFAMKNHIKPYLIIAPMNQATFALYHNSLYERSFDTFLSGLKKTYPHLTILSQPAFFPNTLFGDELHLNKKGTVIYSRQVKEELR